MQRFVVTVELSGTYWSVDLFVEASSRDAAMAQAQQRFDQAVGLGYATGRFTATQATPIQELMNG